MKKIKTLLMAFVAVFALAVVGIKASAEDTTSGVVYSTSEDLKTATWDATACASGVTVTEIKGIMITSGTAKVASSYISIKNNATFTIPVPTSSVGTVNIYADSNNSSRGYTIENNETQYVSTKGATPCAIPFTATDSADGLLALAIYGGELKPTKIEVVLTEGQFAAAAAVYTVTYKDVEGNVLATEKVVDGSYASSEPAKFNYSFGGTYTDVALENAFDQSTTAITGDTVLYVKLNQWEDFTVVENRLGTAENDKISEQIGTEVIFTDDYVLGGTYFTILNGCKMQSAGGEHCIGTVGGISTSQKGVKIVVPTASKITAVMTTAGSSARNGSLIDASGDDVAPATGDLVWDADAAAAYEKRTITYNVEAGTYYLGGENGMRIFSIDVDTSVVTFQWQKNEEGTKVRFLGMIEGLDTPEILANASANVTLALNGVDADPIEITTVYSSVENNGVEVYPAQDGVYYLAVVLNVEGIDPTAQITGTLEVVINGVTYTASLKTPVTFQ